MIHSKILSDFLNQFQGPDSSEVQCSGPFKSLILVTLPKYVRKISVSI